MNSLKLIHLSEFTADNRISNTITKSYRFTKGQRLLFDFA